VQNVIKHALADEACADAATLIQRATTLNGEIRSNRLMMQALVRGPGGQAAVQQPATRWFGRDDMLHRLIVINDYVRTISQDLQLSIS
jgi:hypothetical protein